MKEYTLFLDECKPMAGKLNYFCLAGIVVEKNNYVNKIILDVNLLKNTIFGTTDIILHEIEIRKAKNDFKCLSNKKIREDFWNGVRNILNISDFNVLGVCVRENLLLDIYNLSYANNAYNISLQIILENYVHFLHKNNGIGNIVLESTNTVEDNKLRQLYYSILHTGTLFIKQEAFQTYLTDIKFYKKKDNNIGLQLADMIPNPINRFYSKLTEKEYSLYSKIDELSYNGGLGNEEKKRLGIKIID